MLDDINTLLKSLKETDDKPEIRVDDSKAGIRVVIRNIDFSVDCIGNTSIMFWLDDDEADRLAFQLNSALQDKERTKDETRTK